MKNRKLLLVASLVLAVSMSLGGTLAYLTDTDETVNVMTLGNVDIEQIETDAAGNPFKNNQPLYPAYYTKDEAGNITSGITGEIEKVVSVKNEGTAEAYVRTLLAFEAGELTFDQFEKNIHAKFNTAGDYELDWLETPIEAKEVKYFVACADYGKLAGKAAGDVTLQSVYMDKAATNEIVKQFGETYEIVALSQAVQTTNMPDAATAWKESFGEFNAVNAATWFNGVTVLPAASVATVEELVEAFAEGGTVVLADDIDFEDTMVTIPANTDVYLDLNGHDVSSDLSNYSEEEPTALFTVKKGGSLTISGNGNVHSVANKTMSKVSAIINNDAGNVTINGGNYTMKYGTYDDGYLIPTIVDNNSNVGNATLTINGGTFTHDRNMFRNFSNAASHNNFSTVAKIVINGGTFVADGDGAAYIWNQKPSANVPAGAGVVEINGGTFAGVTVYDEFDSVPEKNPADYNDAVEIIPVAKNNTELDAAINGGEDKIILTGGTFIIPDSAQGKTLTITGNGETVIATQDDGSYEGCDYSLDGATVTFENITINTDSTTYTGYARCKGTYNNCVINGTFTLYDNSVFNDCTFDVSGDVYNIWTWGAPNATFNNCTFNSDGKAMLLYGTANTKLTLNKCVFNDKGGLTDLKAAVEIGNDYGKSYELIVNDTIVNGYEINDKGIQTGSTLWANKNSMGSDKLNVVIDGVDIY